MNEKVIIRQYESSDYKWVWDLHCKALESTWLKVKHWEWENDLHNIEIHYLNNKWEFIIAEINWKIIWMWALRKIDERIWEIKRMRTNPNFQKQWIWTLVLKKLIQKAKEFWYKKLVLDFTPLSIMPLEKFYWKYWFKKYKKWYLWWHYTEYYEKIL